MITLKNLDYFPILEPDKWEPIKRDLLVFGLDDDLESHNPSASIVVDTDYLKICPNSNGYLSWWAINSYEFNRFPDLNHFSYFYFEKLNHCLNELTKSKSHIEINEPAIYLDTTYSGWNIGHDISVILHTALAYYEIVKNDEYKNTLVVVNYDNIKKSKNTLNLIELLFPLSKIIKIKSNVSYRFKQFISPPAAFYHLHHKKFKDKLIEITNKIVNGIGNIEYLNDIIKKYDGRFVLCKRESHTFVRNWGILPCKIEKKIEENNWLLIDPENYSLFEIIYLLQNSKILFLGSGAIQYAHKMFISKDCQIFLLFNGHNYHMDFDLKEECINIPESDSLNLVHWEKFLEKLNGLKI